MVYLHVLDGCHEKLQVKAAYQNSVHIFSNGRQIEDLNVT